MSLTEFNAASGQHAEAADAAFVPATSYGAIALDLIVTSPTNPRTSHNRARLEEALHDRAGSLKKLREQLATYGDEDRTRLIEVLGSQKLTEFVHSIYVHGVNQPILLRPLPAARLADTQPAYPGARRVEYEIIAGERRYFGSRLAGKETIPAMVKAMTDQEALEFQLVENLHRDDLHPMEEAEGYERLCRDTGIQKEDIGAKIGKSRSYVYGRLKLLDLCQDARQAFYEGKLDASRALLIARIPDEKLQIKTLKEFTNEMYGGRTMSVRECQDWLLRNTMLRLDKAPFKITSETLLAAAGSCRACPKRTGANPELFTDVDSADVCTDPKCYGKKEAAHQAQVRADAEAKGLKVIDGKEAQELRPNSWNPIKGYLDLDQPVAGADSDKPLRKLLGKDAPAPVVFMDPHTKQARHLLPTDVAVAALKEKGIESAAARKSQDEQEEKAYEAERRQLQLEYEIEVTWRKRAATEIMGHVRAGGICSFSGPVLREVLKTLVGNEHTAYDENCFEHLLPMWGLPAEVENDYAALYAHVQAAPEHELGTMVLAYMLAREIEFRRWADDTKQTPTIQQLASEAGVDVTAIQGDVKKELTAAAKAALKKELEEAKAKASKKSKKAPTATLPAAQAQGEPEGGETGAAAAPVKKPRAKAARLSAEAAQSGIADAMQNIDSASAKPFSLGQKVRFTQDVKVAGKLRKMNGVEGVIEAAMGDRAFDVRYGTEPGDLVTADYTELEAVEEAEAGDASAGAEGEA